MTDKLLYERKEVKPAGGDPGRPVDPARTGQCADWEPSGPVPFVGAGPVWSECSGFFYLADPDLLLIAATTLALG